MILNTDEEIINREESLRLRLTPGFMKSIGIEVCNHYRTEDLIIFVPTIVLRNFNSDVNLAYTNIIGRNVYLDKDGYRIFGEINSYSRMSGFCTVIVKRVDKLDIKF